MQADVTYPLKDNDKLSSPEYTLRFKDLPDYEKPREKLIEFGPSHLSVAELVAVIWGTGSKREDVLAMAKRAIKEYGDRALSSETSPLHLSSAVDISLNKASQLVASLELGRRLNSARQGRPVQVRNARQAHAYLKDIGQSQKELLRGLYLNSQYRVIHDEVISVGSLTSNIVHPREVFRPAIEHGAIALILAHNHPSGRLEPTLIDLDITEQLVAAGQTLGIDLLDHLIITDKRYLSVIDQIKTTND
jgi:DNA repair protein RadC